MPDTLPASDLLNVHVEMLLARDGIIYGFGWAFGQHAALRRLTLILHTDKNKRSTLAASTEIARPDLALRFPTPPHAQTSGFAVYGLMPPSPLVRAEMAVITEDGGTQYFPVQIDVAVNSNKSTARWKQLWDLGRKAWRLVRAEHFRLLWRSMQNYTRELPYRSTNIAQRIGPSIGQSNMTSAILIVDHNLGGGANVYREHMIEAALEQGQEVFLFSFYKLTLQYTLEYRDRNHTERFALSRPEDLFSILKNSGVREIFYNTCVSFHDPRRIPDLLAYLHAAHDMTVRIAVHDYFCICPSPHLLNNQGRFCHLPDIETCNQCLENNPAASHLAPGQQNILTWRESWERCLRSASELICFSESSYAMLRQVYPKIPEQVFTIHPHAIALPPDTRAPTPLTSPLHIGVVGHLTKAKGAEVVHALAHEARRRGLDVPITLIGWIDGDFKTSLITETGPYQHSSLPSLIQQSGANVFLMPSICPETFSYVTAELIALGKPLACFDLGAQAEQVREYSLGRIVPLASPKTILDELLAFHAALQSQTCSAIR